MSETKKEEYPLYPELTEQGKIEAQAIMDSFKPRLKQMMDEALGDLYTDVIHHIESDSWSNFRGSVIDAIRQYKNTGESKMMDYEVKVICDAVVKDHKDDLIKDLNQDLVKENLRLTEKINTMVHERQFNR